MHTMPSTAEPMLNKITGTSEAATTSPQAASATDAPSALDPNEWKSFKVTEKEQLTHNTIRLKFGLPDANQVVGLPVASCMVTRAPLGDKKEDGSTEQVIRPYTPVSAPDARFAALTRSAEHLCLSCDQ